MTLRQVISHLISAKQITLYTQATSKCRISLELETPLGEALGEDNRYAFLKINNDG